MSTSLTTFSGQTHQQQQIDSLQRELYQRNRELADAEKELASLRQALTDNVNEANNYQSAIFNLRTVLSPLHSALRQVFGEIDSACVSGSLTTEADPRKKAIWDSWKSKLPSGESKAIDSLLLHGSMTTAQLRIHVGCASRTAQNIVAALKSKGLVVKDGAQIVLKEL